MVFFDRKRRVIAARQKRIEQFPRRFWRAAHGVAGGRKIVEQRDDARRHIEADRVTGAARRAGIVRHQDGDPAFARRQCLQKNMRGDPIRDHGDAIRLGPAGESAEGEPGLGWQRILERDGAGQHAAVELGQHHMHGKIGGAEAARAVAPCGALGDGADDLEYRDARRVERRRLVAAAGGKGRHGDDQRRLQPLKRLAQKRARLAIL